MYLPDSPLYAEGGRRTRLRVSLVKQEVAQYKKGLDQHHTQYRIVEETEQPDGSIMIKIIKQYNSSPVGNYLD